jgi:hypothetical protein
MYFAEKKTLSARFTAIFAAASPMVIVEALRPTSSRTKNSAR